MEQVEVWRDIEGFEGLYQVSNYGSINKMLQIVNLERRLKSEKVLIFKS